MREITYCPCCGNVAALWSIAKDHRGISDQEFGYYRCGGCGLVFIDPFPTNLESFYEGGYQPVPESVDKLRSIARKERYRLLPVMEKAGGDLLEIGPWIGMFSINAKDAGFQVDAIEMSREASEFLVKKVGIQVNNTSDVRAALIATDKRYDVITLWHSLEHLPEPWAVLEAASKRLKPGGILLIAIPNIASAQAEALKGQWLHLDAPRHLYFWPPNDLARLVNRFGLRTVELNTKDYLSLVLSRDAWEFFFWSRLKRYKFVRTVLPRMLAPISSLLTGRNRGAGVTAIFKAPQ